MIAGNTQFTFDWNEFISSHVIQSKSLMEIQQLRGEFIKALFEDQTISLLKLAVVSDRSLAITRMTSFECPFHELRAYFFPWQ